MLKVQLTKSLSQSRFLPARFVARLAKTRLVGRLETRRDAEMNQQHQRETRKENYSRASFDPTQVLPTRFAVPQEWKPRGVDDRFTRRGLFMPSEER